MKKIFSLILVFSPLSFTEPTYTYDCVMEAEFEIKNRNGKTNIDGPYFSEATNDDVKFVKNKLIIDYQNSSLQFLRSGKIVNVEINHKAYQKPSSEKQIMENMSEQLNKYKKSKIVTKATFKEKITGSKLDFDRFSCKVDEGGATEETIYEESDSNIKSYSKWCNNGKDATYVERTFLPFFEKVSFTIRKRENKPTRLVTGRHDFSYIHYEQRAISIEQGIKPKLSISYVNNDFGSQTKSTHAIRHVYSCSST